MRKQHQLQDRRYGWDGMFPEPEDGWRVKMRDRQIAEENSPEEVLGQVGLVLVATLGIVLVINSLLIVFHIT